MCNLQRRLRRYCNYVNNTTVVEVELEESIRMVATIEITSIPCKVVQSVIHLWDVELFYKLAIAVVLPELAQLY